MARLSGRNKIRLRAYGQAASKVTTAVPAAVSAANGAAAAGSAPTKAEFDVVVTLANALKTAVNGLVTLTTEQKSDFNALVDTLNK